MNISFFQCFLQFWSHPEAMTLVFRFTLVSACVPCRSVSHKGLLLSVSG